MRVGITLDLSIIVPVYNEGELLRRLVDSILFQEPSTLTYELLLIDDGSQDESPRICDEYAQKYEQVKAFHKPNGGCVDARRCGLSHAQGRYIAFADGDDYVEKDYLKNIETALEHKADYYFFNNKKTFFLQSGLYVEKDFLQGGYLPVKTAAAWILMGKAGAVWDKLYSKRFIDEKKILLRENISHGEDVYININIVSGNPRIYVQDTSSYVHIANSPTSMFALHAELKRLDEIRILYETSKRVLESLQFTDLLKPFQTYILGEFVKNIGLMLKGGENKSDIQKYFSQHGSLNFIQDIQPETTKGRLFAYILQHNQYTIAYWLTWMIHTKPYYRKLDRKVECRKVAG